MTKNKKTGFTKMKLKIKSKKSKLKQYYVHKATKNLEVKP